MSKSLWVADADNYANEIFDALTQDRERDAKRRFDEMTLLTSRWCYAELKANGVSPNEIEDCLPRIWERLWLTLVRRSAQGESLRSVLATLTPIVRSVSIDRLRQAQRPYRRLKNHLTLLCEQGSLFTRWTTSGNTEVVGRVEWKTKSPQSNFPFGEWHREHIRLTFDEQTSSQSLKSLAERLLSLLEIIFRTYASPLRLKELEGLCMDFLDLKTIEAISLQTSVGAENASGTTLEATLPSPQPGVAETVVRQTAFAPLLARTRTVLSALSARTQETILLTFETDTLDCYCVPESSVNVLSPLHEEAFELSLAEARLLAAQDAEAVPISDETIAERLKITKGNLQILRFRARKRLIEAGLDDERREWLAE